MDLLGFVPMVAGMAMLETGAPKIEITSEMIERVAGAIWRADPAHTRMKWSECDETFREVKRMQARAAIEAMFNQ